MQATLSQRKLTMPVRFQVFLTGAGNMPRFTRDTIRRSPRLGTARVTRRKLLTAVVAAGAGAIAAPLVLPSRLFGAQAPSQRLNVAAVGTGGRSRALMTEILRQGSVERF